MTGRMISSRGEGPPLDVTHVPVGRTTGIIPTLDVPAVGMVTYVRRPQFPPLALARNRLAGDDQDDPNWLSFNPYSPYF